MFKITHISFVLMMTYILALNAQALDSTDQALPLDHIPLNKLTLRSHIKYQYLLGNIRMATHDSLRELAAPLPTTRTSFTPQYPDPLALVRTSHTGSSRLLAPSQGVRKLLTTLIAWQNDDADAAVGYYGPSTVRIEEILDERPSVAVPGVRKKFSEKLERLLSGPQTLVPLQRGKKPIGLAVPKSSRFIMGSANVSTEMSMVSVPYPKYTPPPQDVKPIEIMRLGQKSAGMFGPTLPTLPTFAGLGEIMRYQSVLPIPRLTLTNSPDERSVYAGSEIKVIEESLESTPPVARLIPSVSSDELKEVQLIVKADEAGGKLELLGAQNTKDFLTEEPNKEEKLDSRLKENTSIKDDLNLLLPDKPKGYVGQVANYFWESSLIKSLRQRLPERPATPEFLVSNREFLYDLYEELKSPGGAYSIEAKLRDTFKGYVGQVMKPFWESNTIKYFREHPGAIPVFATYGVMWVGSVAIVLSEMFPSVNPEPFEVAGSRCSYIGDHVVYHNVIPYDKEKNVFTLKEIDSHLKEIEYTGPKTAVHLVRANPNDGKLFSSDFFLALCHEKYGDQAKGLYTYICELLSTRVFKIPDPEPFL